MGFAGIFFALTSAAPSLRGPSGEDVFMQANTYLHVVADRVVATLLGRYRDPVRTADDISAAGPRHVGYAISTELLGPFVSARVEAVQGVSGVSEMCVKAGRWSLGVVSQVLVLTIIEGHGCHDGHPSPPAADPLRHLVRLADVRSSGRRSRMARGASRR